jgi:hypothetical protein
MTTSVPNQSSHRPGDKGSLIQGMEEDGTLVERKWNH